MLIDSHAHLNFKAFDQDWQDVSAKCLDQDIWVINVGSKYETSKKAVEITDCYENGIYSAIGLHPIHAQEGFNKEEYVALAKNSKTVAIGEIGLDKFNDYWSFFEEQKRVFISQLNLAEELNLPVIIHCRKAHKEILEILSRHKVSGVIHCFTGSWSEAQKYLDMGFYLGINGIMYKMNIKESIKKTPLDRLLIETDCPYLTPPLPAEALAKEGRNEPMFVKYIAKDIARIRGVSFEEIAEATTYNAQTLFGI